MTKKKKSPNFKAMRDKVKPGAVDAVNMKLPGMMPMDMDKLESASGGAFDHEFIDMTIKHHQGGVMMAKSELKSGKNKSVKEKAQMIIDKQSKEIAEMKQMREAMK